MTRPEFFSADHRAQLLAIIRARSFRTGTFTLASGATSSVYYDLKPTMMNAAGAELAARAMIAIIDEVGADYVSGLEMGAVPLIGAIAAVSRLLGRPVETTFVRKKPKDHGTTKLVEGLMPEESIAGQRVFVIDDVSTSGGSTLKAIEAIRAEGGLVTDAACLVNREQGGDALMAANGVRLHHVFTAAEIAG